MSKKRNNQVSEWFGHRVFPEVSDHPNALKDQQSETCPFLTRATSENRKCVKSTTSLGVCAISSTSNGRRQGWLVCPHRALDAEMLEDVVERMFTYPSNELTILPVSTLSQNSSQEMLLSELKHGRRVIVYFHDKLGGEISFSKTERSPEMKMDMTLVEIVQHDETLSVGNYGILELQTMEFHGSYRHVVKNLKDSLRLFGQDFHNTLQKNQQWVSEKIEGPNIANVFKRTFYQMMFKFQLGAQDQCVGTTLAIPEAVWDSWQRHLGRPELVKVDDYFTLLRPDSTLNDAATAWIYVYDIQPIPAVSPNPARILKRIATNADSIGFYALTVAPNAAIENNGAMNYLPTRIKLRLRKWWPEFGDPLG